jgi:hypothetical protein
MSLVEIAPNRWVVEKRRIGVARSNLSLPYVISDEMPPTEQVDGKFYTSKRTFRAVGRAYGLTEVGNERLPPKQRASIDLKIKHQRREALKVAREKVRAGYRVRSG